MKTPPFYLLAAMALLYVACSAPRPPEEASYLGLPVAEVEAELDRLMAIWYPRIVDEDNGGYWTNFEADWSRSEEQTKMLVTQARGLWTAARACRHYPEQARFRAAADAGYRFLTQRMWDAAGNGGFFQYFPPPAPEPGFPAFKMAYGNAFALFALSEYAKIGQEPEVLEWVERAFRWLEDHSHDPEQGGYFNLIFDAPLSLTDTAQQAYARRIGWGAPNWKDQNSSIHLLEALSTTYQVWPDSLVGVRLEEMLHLVRDTMVHPDGYLHLYFTRDWQPISHRDSSRTYILEHLSIDHQSFGHDIETAYLLIEAAEVLYGQVDPATLEVARKLVEHTLQYGFDENYYGLFDRGYRFRPELEMEIVNDHKVWWAQAEAWHTLGLMPHYFPEDERYPEAFRGMWRYIRKELIDPEYGGWYNNGLDTDPDNISRRKAHPWKGAYHNGRALFQIVDYAREDPE